MRTTFSCPTAAPGAAEASATPAKAARPTMRRVVLLMAMFSVVGGWNVGTPFGTPPPVPSRCERLERHGPSLVELTLAHRAEVLKPLYVELAHRVLLHRAWRFGKTCRNDRAPSAVPPRG